MNIKKIVDSKRIIYYYQTFIGLSDILKKNTPVTHIHLSSIHFGNDSSGNPYIHLNDHPPNNPIFNSVWDDIQKAKNLGMKIVLMVGGAGSAYTKLFSNFEVYYDLLYQTITAHSVIDGIDLDIEELVDIKNVKMLINRINKDFGADFIISMAPLGSSLGQNYPGMGGFVYKNLYNSDEGKRINYFNGQFYTNYSVCSYTQAIHNGFPENKVVMGMLGGQNLPNALSTISQLVKTFPNFGGVFVWEYFNSSSNPKQPGLWATEMKKVISKSIKM